jgi:FkbM family methyltransferase
MNSMYSKKFVLFLHSHPSLLGVLLRIYGAMKGIKVSFSASKILFKRNGHTILLGKSNLAYSRDVITNFEFYFKSTTDIKKDFSQPGYHNISGFTDFPIHTPGLPEPMETLKQYCGFLKLKAGNTILDLGSYSGLSSIIFSQLVGPTGTVIAIEADPVNAVSSETNFQKAKVAWGHSPHLVKKAIWHEETVLEFASEANLGSAVKELLPRSKIPGVLVSTVTLSKLVSDFNLKNVDAIKADIEGAEYWAFSDKKFFSEYHPKIIFEPAEEQSELTKGSQVIALLETYGYCCTRIEQIGSPLPLIFCE